MERARGSAIVNSLSMYSVTENIYSSQLSSVAILLQPEPNCFTSYNTRKGLFSLYSCAIALRSSPPFNVSTCNGQRSSQLFCVHYMYSSCNFTRSVSVITDAGSGSNVGIIGSMTYHLVR
jgi:hypothetical protein